MLHVPVVAGNPSLMPFGMGNNNPVRQRVQIIHPAQISEQFHCILISSKHMILRTAPVPGLRPVCTARIPYRGRLRHLHAYVRPVCVTAAVPSPIIPRQELVHVTSRLNDGMDTGSRIRLIPVIDKGRRFRLWTAHGMDHQPLYRNLLPCPVTPGLC